MICKTCGAQYNDTDNFCGICGTPNPNLTNTAAYGNEQDTVVAPTNTSNSQPEEKNEAEAEMTEVKNSAEFPDPTVTKPTDNNAETFPSENPKGEESFEQNAARDNNAYNAHTVSDVPNFSDNSSIPNAHSASNTPGVTNIPQNNKKSDSQKDKRVCSLSAVVICIIVILILSVALGAVSGLYIGEKRRNTNMRNGSVLANSSYSVSADYR